MIAMVVCVVGSENVVCVAVVVLGTRTTTHHPILPWVPTSHLPPCISPFPLFLSHTLFTLLLTHTHSCKAKQRSYSPSCHTHPQLQAKATLLLTIQAAPPSLQQQYAPTADLLTTTLLEHLRVRGRSAYIALSPSTATPAPLQDQALVLLALTSSGEEVPQQLLQKLVVGVAGMAGGGGGGGWLFLPWSGGGTATVLLALQQYDAVVGNTEPDLTVCVWVGRGWLLLVYA